MRRPASAVSERPSAAGPREAWGTGPWEALAAARERDFVSAARPSAEGQLPSAPHPSAADWPALIARRRASADLDQVGVLSAVRPSSRRAAASVWTAALVASCQACGAPLPNALAAQQRKGRGSRTSDIPPATSTVVLAAAVV